METQFRESFTKDLWKIRDKSLLKRVESIIETVEQARRLEETKHIVGVAMVVGGSIALLGGIDLGIVNGPIAAHATSYP
jgi:hypothetical protein